MFRFALLGALALALAAPAHAAPRRGGVASLPQVFQDFSNFLNSDFAGAATLSTAIPSAQDGNGQACWTKMQNAGAIFKAHPVPLTLKLATDLEAERLLLITAAQLCAYDPCRAVFDDQATAVASLGVGVPVLSLTALCSKIPPIAVVAPASTPASTK